ncbi:ATP-dependent RNA helicase [Thecaphora frezii]
MAPSHIKKSTNPKRPQHKRSTPKSRSHPYSRPSAASAAATNSSVSAPSKKAARYVPHSSLAWSSVHIPTEAISGGAGTTDSTFFHNFSFDDDDFMGLQEVDDVDVEFELRKDGGRTIKFKTTEDKLKKTTKKGKRKQQDDDQDAHGEDQDEQDGELSMPSQAVTKAAKRKRAEKEDNGDGSDEEQEEYVSPFGAEHEEDEGEEDEDSRSGDYDPTEAQNDAETEGDALDQDLEADVEAEDENDDQAMDDDDLAVAFSKAQSAGLNLGEDDEEDGDDEFDEALLPGWSAVPLHSELKRGLYNMGFAKPTEIQARSLPPALGLGRADTAPSSDAESDGGSESDGSQADAVGVKKDVIGVSQTGSGKTLAYGLPILQWLYQNAPGSVPMPSGEDDEVDESLPTPLGALILTPTRELALQVATHLSDVIRASCRSSPSDDVVSKRKLSRRPHVAVVCGGMSEQKQKRMLEGRSRSSGGADIVVATPGRLWEMARLDDRLAARIKRTRFLVLDEADRMVEVGHFAEMEHILKLVSREHAEAPEDDAAAEESQDGDGGEPLIVGVRPSDNMQTFVFSATLSKRLQINLQRRKRIPAKAFNKRKNGKQQQQEATTLDELMERVDFRDEAPLIVNLTGGQGLPQGLVETKVECLHTDKDLYLYYFLLRYPGRTLVFVNSIDGIRRLQSILANLRINVFPLHSQLQQKQRLRNLDRFRATQLSKAKTAGEKMAAASNEAHASLGGSSSVLLATDVAARGLDIPAVDHVVHYQLPRSADSYVHRSGRTARAGATGVALALIEPKEKKLWGSLCKALGKRQDTLSLPILYSLLPALKQRLALARELDQKRHKTSKASHEESWLRNLASEAELELPQASSDEEGGAGRSGGTESARKTKIYVAQVRELERQLDVALRQPLKQRGTSRKYITASLTGNGNLASQLVGDSHHETVLGLSSSTAETDLKSLSSAARKPGSSRQKVAAATPNPAANAASVPPATAPAPRGSGSSGSGGSSGVKKLPTTPVAATATQKRRAHQRAQRILELKRNKRKGASSLSS